MEIMDFCLFFAFYHNTLISCTAIVHVYVCIYIYIYIIVFFGCWYAVIRIKVVEFIAKPSRNWTFQHFARLAEKERTQRNKLKI